MDISAWLPNVCALSIGIVILIIVIRLTTKRPKQTGNFPKPSQETESSIHPVDHQYTPAASASPVNATRRGPGLESSGHIFISYRRSDSADIAGRIYDRLIDSFGKNPIFKDVDSIPLGFDFKEYLDAKVSECNALLAIIGDRWVDATDAAGKKRLEDPADFVRLGKRDTGDPAPGAWYANAV